MNLFWSTPFFWIISLACVVLAMFFVLPSLMRNKGAAHAVAARRDINLAVYRDQMKDLHTELANTQLTQEQFLASKLELETRAAEDALSQVDRVATPATSRWLGVSLATVLPMAAIAMYVWLGNPGVLIAITDDQKNADTASQPGEANILRLIDRMQERATANPSDSEVWEALITANAMMGRWPEALQAAEMALALLPNKPAVMSAYAEALAMNSGMLLLGTPIDMVNKALKTDPNDPKGLELAGIHAFDNEQYAQAVEFLDRLLQLILPNTFYAEEILRMRNEAQREVSLNASLDNTSTTAVASVGGIVDIAPALRQQLHAKSTLYLIARVGVDGPPVAATRLTMSELPFRFQLDDSMAMSPNNTLSMHKKVVLLARISVSGNPIAQAGDIEGQLVGVEVGVQNVHLVIDRVIP